MIPTRKLSEHEKCSALAGAFKTAFGRDPKFVAMAPGRVNLIGEHIDYCGYSVLPIALDRSIRLACDFETGQDGLHLANCNAKYTTFQSDTLDAPIDTKKPLWHMYFLCGYRAIVDYTKAKNLELPKLRLTVLADGDVPPNAGLSSSSAFVVASALTVARAAGLEIPKVEMAQLCAKAEQYIGTEGGGMDQAVSLMAEKGKALLVHFGPPLEVEPRQLPSDVRFVVANSLVEVNKAASSAFNERVAECRVAAKLLTRRHSSTTEWRSVRTLRDTQLAMGLHDPQSALDAVYNTLIHESEQHAGNGGLEADDYMAKDYEDRHGTWTRAQVVAELGCTDEEFARDVLGENTQHMQVFHVGARARHIYSEAARTLHVAQLCHALEEDERRRESVPPEVTLDEIEREMGHLMSKSHQSLDQFYQCSHPDVNQLVELALSCGSYGSRITGAGWGGCTIHLVPTRKIEVFMETLRSEFYGRRTEEETDGAVFVVEPGPCAAIYL